MGDQINANKIKIHSSATEYEHYQIIINDNFAFFFLLLFSHLVHVHTSLTEQSLFALYRSML